MDAVLYLRQSQDRSGDQLSVERQREDARALARIRDWTVVDEHVDNDISARGTRTRPAFELALQDLMNGRARVIIAWDMSRLSRNARDTLRLLEAGEAANGILAFVRGSDLNLSTADGRLIAGILSSIAQGEVDKKAERQRRAARQAAERGKRIAGRRAFGYGVHVGEDPETGKPIIDYDRIVAVEAAALRKAYTDCLQGVFLGTIAKEWNAKGLLPTQGSRDGTPNTWSAQNLRPVLLNPRYAGLRSHLTRDLLKQHHPVKARIIGIVGAAAWPAIIDEPTWRAVVAKLMDPSRTTNDRSDRKFLTGVARCGVCGAKVHGGGNHLGKSIYRCSADYGHLARKAQPVDEYVGEFTVAFLSRSDAVKVLRKGDRPDLEGIRAEMVELRARLNEQASLHADGVIDTGQLRAGSALLRRRLDELDAQLTELGQVSVVAPLVDAADPAAAWAELSPDRRRAVVEHLFDIEIRSPGRGVRAFRPETVVITRREA